MKEPKPMYHIQRVQCADGQPICIMENYLLASMFPNLNFNLQNFVSLYEYLEKNYGIALTEAAEAITAVGASFMESQILRVPMNTPLLLSTRITYSQSQLFEYVILKVLADRYKYKIFLSGRS